MTEGTLREIHATETRTPTRRVTPVAASTGSTRTSPRLQRMPGPRRTLAAAVCAAVVGLFLVAGVGVAQASPQHRATMVHASSATHHAAHVRSTGDHTDHRDLDLWSLPPVEADQVPELERGAAPVHAVVPVPGQAVRPLVRGPPAA